MQLRAGPDQVHFIPQQDNFNDADRLAYPTPPQDPVREEPSSVQSSPAEQLSPQHELAARTLGL